jgi:hypothetical protein
MGLETNIKDKTEGIDIEYPLCPDRNVCSALGCPVNVDPSTCSELSAEGYIKLKSYYM